MTLTAQPFKPPIPVRWRAFSEPRPLHPHTHH
jgi:hypothetical protein